MGSSLGSSKGTYNGRKKRFIRFVLLLQKNAKQEIKASNVPMEMVPTWDASRDSYHGDKDHFPMYSLYMETTGIFRMTL